MRIPDIVEIECKRLGLEPSYILAMIQVESGGNQWATRYEVGFSYLENPEYWANKTGVTLDTEISGQKTSRGVLQVMGGTARYLGFSGYLPELHLLGLGIHYGCRLLSQKLIKYGTYEDAISAYNAGSPRKLGPKYENQIYVDRVLEARKAFI